MNTPNDKGIKQLKLDYVRIQNRDKIGRIDGKLERIHKAIQKYEDAEYPYCAADELSYIRNRVQEILDFVEQDEQM